jgi:hypothetical protein
MALSVPEPQPNDPEDLSTALETAAIFGAQGDVREAVRWVRRAAELAGDAGDDMRALTLARAVADLGESVAPAAPAPEPPADGGSSAAATGVAAAPPPPPPLPAQDFPSNGDRITNPGIAPASTPPDAPPVQAALEPSSPLRSRPASVPPPTATEDAGWSDSDSEPETPHPTNGAADGHAVAPAIPAAASAQAVAFAMESPGPAAPSSAAVPATSEPASHQAVRVRVEPTTETGVFRLTLLAARESAGPDAHEALLVLLDPAGRLES